MRDLRSIASTHNAMRVMPLRKPWKPSRASFRESRYDRVMHSLSSSAAFVVLLGMFDVSVIGFLAHAVLWRH